MKKIATLILFLLVFCIPEYSQAAWYDDAWEYRQEIQSNQTLVESSETDMPLYLDLSLLGSDFFSNIKSDGSDIIITADDEVTTLDYELVSLDVVSETGELHFKADGINNSSDTSYFIYYGNSGTNPFVSGNVWNDYQGVWHFEDDLMVDQVQNLGVASISAIDGGDGGWAVWYGNNPIGTNLNLAIDEDQVVDTDRAHTTEQVSYWILEDGIEDIVDNNGTIIGEVGVVDTVGSTLSSVAYNNSYTNPIVIVTPQYTSGVPAVARIDNLDTNGFDTFLQNPTPSAQAGTPDDTSIYYLVIESGNHLLPGNIPLEAGSVTVTGVNNKNDYSNSEMVQIIPVQTFVNPAVLGSIHTNNNAQWQTFWSSNGTTSNPPTGSSIYVGRQTGETTSPTVVDETIGYVIIESHANSNGGFDSRAALGSDSIEGVGSAAPPYVYPGFSGGNTSIIGFSDATVNGFDTSIVGGISSNTGQMGFGSDFSGSGSRTPITGLNYSQNNSLDELTASFWLNTTDTARSGIFDFDRSEHWEIGLNFHNAAGQAGTISFDTASSAGGIQDMNSAVIVNDGAWHHVVVVFDAADPSDKRIYIDGQLDSSLDQHTGSLGTGVTRFGLFGDGSEDGSGNGNANNIPYEGLLDEARIQHQAQTAGWIETTYNNQSDNNTFWTVSSQMQQNLSPDDPTNLFFDNTDAQAGNTNPINVEVGGSSSLIPYFSAIYNGDGDTATSAYIQVSTDSTFTTIDYWDSGWFSLGSSTNDGDRSEDIEYDGMLTGATAALLPLSMDDGATTYYWRIAYEDNSGLQGDFSDPATFTLLDTPATPGNVSVTKVEGTPDTFIVNWQDTSIGETSFEVEFREDTGSGFGAWQSVTLPISSPTPANTTSWGMDNTVNNAVYNFRVRSCNYSNCSTWTEDPLDHYTDPEAPVGVCSEYISDTQFNITWTNRAIFDQSTIEQCDSGDCLTPSFTTIAINQAEPGPVASSGTITNELYRWSVFADNGMVSSEPTYSNIEYTKPGIPTDVEAVRISDSIIHLSWTDVSTYEDGFRIYVRENGGNAIELTSGVNTTSANTTSYTYTGASAGNEYQFEVRAHIGQTVCGSITNMELLSDPGLSNTVFTTPQAPLITTAVHNADNDLEIFWLDQSTYEDGFRIYVRENGGSWSVAGVAAADTTSYMYTTGSSDSVYDFYVEVFTNIANPNNPDTLSNTLGPTEFRRVYTTPTAPILGNILVSSTSADWSVVDNADYELGFTVYDGTTFGLIQSITSPNVTNFTETGLTPNSSLDRLVRAYVENNGVRLESGDSNIVSIFTLANSPADPTVTEIDSETIQIDWLSGGNPIGTEYFIENTTTGMNSGWVADVLTFTETSLVCETTYEYILKARNGNGIETGEEIIEVIAEDCPASSSGGSRRISQEKLSEIFNNENKEIVENKDPLEETCTNQILFTENMKQGDRDGNYSLWKNGPLSEIKKLQIYMNLGGYRSGPVDGIFGPITDKATKRMQGVLNTFVDGQVGPITRSKLNDTCNTPHPELTNSILNTVLNLL